MYSFLFNSRPQADLQLVCPNGFIVPANKDILAANCEFFKNAFDSQLGFTEASTGTIELQDPAAAVESMIESLYYGDYDTDDFVNQQAANGENLNGFVGPLSHHFKMYILRDKYLLPDLQRAAHRRIRAPRATSIEDFLETVVCMNNGCLETNSNLVRHLAAKAVTVSESDHDTRLLWQQKGIENFSNFLIDLARCATTRANRKRVEEERLSSPPRPLTELRFTKWDTPKWETPQWETVVLDPDWPVDRPRD